MTRPMVLCTPWCSDHDDAGTYDQWCRTIGRVELVSDEDPVTVEVTRHAGRPNPGAGWREDQGWVYLDGKALLPHEALEVAKMLLAAHALAVGTAAEW